MTEVMLSHLIIMRTQCVGILTLPTTAHWQSSPIRDSEAVRVRAAGPRGPRMVSS